MIIELVAFFGLLIIVLFTFAEIFKYKFLGVVASVLLLILAMMILNTGIQMVTVTNTVQTLGIP